MARRVEETVFKGTDQVSKVLASMTRNSKRFGDTTSRSMKKATKSALSFKSVVGGILAAGVVTRGLSAMQQGLRTVTDEFLDFDDAITAASAKFGIFERDSKAFQNLKDVARDVGATTEFTSAQAAEGLRFLAKAGWAVNDSMKALPSFVNLATASEMDFARAADIATDVMGSFQLKTDDTAKNLQELERVNNVLTKAVNMSNIDMENLFETMKFAGPVAKTAGVSLEKFSAMAAFIGGAGIKGSLGGTALRTMFIALASPTKNAAKELDKLGISIKTSTGDLRDPIEVLKELGAGFKDMGKAQQVAALNLLFGRRAVSGAAVSVKGATGKLQEFELALEGSKGNAEKLATFMRTSFKKRFAELKSTAIEVGFKFIDAFEKKMPGAIDKAVKALREIDVDAIIKDMQEFWKELKKVRDVLKDYVPILKGIALAWGALQIGAAIKAVGIFAIKFGALVTAAGGFLPALAALLGPVGAFALAVGGVGAAVITVIDNWDDLKLTVKWAIDDIVGWFDKMLDNPFFTAAALLLNPWITIPALILKHWEPIKEFFQELIIDFKTITSKGLGFLGIKSPFDTKVTDTPGPQVPYKPRPLVSTHHRAPNAAEQEARKTPLLEGNITLTGAPKGTKFETKTRHAPKVKTEVLGNAA